MNVEKTQKQVKKAIDKFGKEVEIRRNGVNEFNEPNDEPSIVTTIKGYYYKGQSISINTSEAGEVAFNKEEKLMIVLDIKGQKVQTGDYFLLNDIKYEIADLGNNFDIYLDMTLKRV